MAAEHPTKKLGRRFPKRTSAIRLRDVLTGVIPDHPLKVDHFSKVSQWILGGNDQYGVCGPVAVANYRLMLTTALSDYPQVVTQEQIFDLYRRSGNPNFDPETGEDDNGVDNQTMLEAVHKGGIAGIPTIAHACLDSSDIEEYRAAIAIFGGVIMGVTLEEAQQSQEEVWRYVPSPIWGGHDILGGQYDETDTFKALDIVSWAKVYGADGDFVKIQTSGTDSWIPIFPEHLGTRQFIEGIDQDALKNAYLTLTGRTLSL